MVWTNNAFNTVLEKEGFYISYLFPKSGLFSGTSFDSDTDEGETALVKDSHFYILNGDYRKEYEELVDLGFEECYKFFKNNPNKSRWTEED